MHRRRVLQMGAVVATLPLVGCGATAPDAKPPADGQGPPGPDKLAGGDAGANEAAADAGAVEAPAAPPPVPEAPKVAYTRVIARIGKNHNHELTVPFAEVETAAEKTFTMTTVAGHLHKVTLSADEMKSMLAGKVVRTKSSLDKGHQHRVVVKCAPAVDPPEWIASCRVEFSGKDEHELIVPMADREAKSEKVYDIQGTAGHTHAVTITAEGFEKLAKKEALSLKASREPEDQHTHVVVVYPDLKKKKG